MSTRERSRDNVFAALNLDRQSDKREDADWLAAQHGGDAAAYLLLREDGRALVDAAGNALRLLRRHELAQLPPEIVPSFLGVTEGAHFSVRIADAHAEQVAAALDARFLDLRSAGLRLPAFDAGLFAYARALAFWQERTRYCSVCGARNELLSGGHRARCSNAECKTEHFPRTDPAVIVIVGWQDACLLGRQPSWPERRYSTLAGFVEPGETLEDAVRREVFEEAGVRVGACEYHSSQPWPFPSSLMLGFTAQAEDPHIQVGAELAEARWFRVEELVAALADRSLVLPPPLSVSFRLIEHWLRETGGVELLPLLSDEPWLQARR